MNDSVDNVIEEWQNQWDKLQTVIDDMIELKNFSEAYRYQVRASAIKNCIQRLYALKENLSEVIIWKQVELSARIEHSNEYFIDGFVHGVKKYEAIGSYTVGGNELEGVRDIETT